LKEEKMKRLTLVIIMTILLPAVSFAAGDTAVCAVKRGLDAYDEGGAKAASNTG
jgi:hypothetical protein